MNEKIKTNEYIRTANGNIFQVKRTGDKKVYTKETTEDGRMYGVFKECIIKHSPNLTDLIKKGDYVNGHLVVEVRGNYIITEIGTYVGTIIYYKDGIKDIVTKEVYERVKYTVETN